MTAYGRKRTPAVTDITFVHRDGPHEQVEVLRASVLRARHGASLCELKRPDFHVMLLVLEGRGAHHLDFRRVALRRGDVLHVRPGQVHAFSAKAGFEALCVLFRPEALLTPLLVSNAPGAERLRPHAEDFELLCELAVSIETMADRTRDVRVATVAPHLLAALWSALEHLVEKRHRTPLALPRDTVELVRAYEALVELHYADRWTTTRYARALHVATRTLARACRAVLGRTPKDCLDARVALEAQRRLVHTDVTVESLAEALGFSEATNFVKFFARRTGRTPAAFRRRVRG
ncbi:MAG: helix-turn-helix transcriptional regulator [Deltaproteobacteria bacterium]